MNTARLRAQPASLGVVRDRDLLPTIHLARPARSERVESAQPVSLSHERGRFVRADEENIHFASDLQNLLGNILAVGWDVKWRAANLQIAATSRFLRRLRINARRRRFTT